MSFDHGKAVVVVGPGFFQLDLKARQGLTRTANCLFMAGDDGCINFDLLHYQSGVVVARNHFCRYEPR